MKTKTLTKITILLASIFVIFCTMFVFSVNTSTNKVYAQSDQLQIENDGAVITSELWVALYNAYQKGYGQKPAGDVLTIDMFKNFPETTLNLSTNLQGQSYGITSISGLGEFDLSAFDTINLSGNNITTLNNEFKNIQNLKEINLSNNYLSTFKTDMLHNSCLTSLQVLNLSNNGINVCDLSGLQNTEINLENNSLTIEGLTYPQINLNINLNKNYLTELDTTNLKQNVIYGYQGPKNEQTFEKTTDILFVTDANVDISKIEIYENDILQNTLTQTQKTTLFVGNYNLKFFNRQNEKVQETSFKVLLPKVTAKLFVDGKEIEFTSVLNQNAVIKFYGEDGAEIFITSNITNQTVKATEFEINKNGTVVVTVYQTKDGYTSNTASFYFNVSKSTIGSWVIVIVGIVAIILLYFVFKFIVQKIISKTTYKTIKGKLD